MKLLHSTAPTLVLAALLAACSDSGAGDGGGPVTTGGTPETTPQDASVDQDPAPAEEVLDFTPGGPIGDSELAGYYVEMDCAIDGESIGTMTLQVWSQMPATARNFLRYCAENYYAGSAFTRVGREGVAQAGHPGGDTDLGPYGAIPDETNLIRSFGHGYGVLSMARSSTTDEASCEFAICCADGPDVWARDGNNTSFGKIAMGVATLEALAGTPVRRHSISGELSDPLADVVIVETRVRRGPPPSTEEIVRPMPVFEDEEPLVKVQQFVISLVGRDPEPRTHEEAEALAAIVFERARAGEDFSSLVREFSDAEIGPGTELPGLVTIANTGVPTPVQDRLLFDGFQEINGYRHELNEQLKAGLITTNDFRRMANQRREEVLARVQPLLVKRRHDFPNGVARVVFRMKVGEIVKVDQDPSESASGWVIIKRLE